MERSPMKRLFFSLFVLAVVTTQPVAQTQTAQRSIDRTGAVRSMLDAYCIGCHSSTARAGGVAFAGMSLDDIGSNAEVWEKAVRKLRGRLMPRREAVSPIKLKSTLSLLRSRTRLIKMLTSPDILSR